MHGCWMLHSLLAIDDGACYHKPAVWSQQPQVCPCRHLSLWTWQTGHLHLLQLLLHLLPHHSLMIQPCRAAKAAAISSAVKAPARFQSSDVRFSVGGSRQPTAHSQAAQYEGSAVLSAPPAADDVQRHTSPQCSCQLCGVNAAGPPCCLAAGHMHICIWPS